MTDTVILQYSFSNRDYLESEEKQSYPFNYAHDLFLKREMESLLHLSDIPCASLVICYMVKYPKGEC